MKIKTVLSIFTLFFTFYNNLYSKRMMLSKDYYKPIINKKCWFNLKRLYEILESNPEISYQKCLEQIPFDFQPFPPSHLYPHKGICSDCFILKIPNGKVQGKLAHIFVQDTMIEEMVWESAFEILINVPKVDQENVIKVKGRVAVIGQSLYDFYFHWFQDILGRLALLEIYNTDFDYIYVPLEKSFMRETLELWGIPSEKIIVPDSPTFCLQADELIVPSYVLNKNAGFAKYAGFHQNPITSRYVSEKLLHAAQAKNIDTTNFAKRIFISRKDAPQRKIVNEDEIFKLFEAKGFVRYELSKLSVAEQILLFHNAEMVAGEHGAGITNCLFCKPHTKVIEIFQALIDSGPWWITQVMNLDYSCIQTVNVDPNYFARYTLKPEFYKKAWKSQMAVNPYFIQKAIESL